MIETGGKKGGTQPIKFGDSPSIDAFARLRVSEPLTIFDSKQLFDNAPLFWDDQEVSGSGTSSTYTQAKASTTLSVSDTTAGKRVRQTFMRFNYQPGKSQLVFMTGTLGLTGGGAGIKRGAGIYDDDNGIFFQDNGGAIEAVVRSSTTGSAVDNSVTQNDFNLDKLDGTGASGVTLDPLASQILVFDFEWLGVGRIRCGFVFDGVPVYCHEFNHANVLAGVYMSTPNLPLRYEIENTGAGSAASLEHICSTVVSEGGQNEIGSLNYHSNDDNDIDANSIGTTYMLAGIRLKTTHIGATVKLLNQSIINDTTDNYEWVLVFNPTVAGSPTWTDKANSAVQTTVGSSANPSTTTVTGGQVIAGGYVKSSGNSGDVTLGVDSAILLGAAIDGTVDELFLCVKPLSTNANVSGALTWRELS